MKTQEKEYTASPEMRQCIQNCRDCQHICMETIAHCLDMGGKHAEASHIRILLDCAEMCQTSANFMVRNSLRHGRTCVICAEVCELCAQDCERMREDMQMLACAEVCRRCAASCQRMAAVAA